MASGKADGFVDDLEAELDRVHELSGSVEQVNAAALRVQPAAGVEVARIGRGRPAAIAPDHHVAPARHAGSRRESPLAGLNAAHAQAHAVKAGRRGVGVEQLDVVGVASAVDDDALVAGEDLVENRPRVRHQEVVRSRAAGSSEIHQRAAAIGEPAAGDAFEGVCVTHAVDLLRGGVGKNDRTARSRQVEIQVPGADPLVRQELHESERPDERERGDLMDGGSRREINAPQRDGERRRVVELDPIIGARQGVGHPLIDDQVGGRGRSGGDVRRVGCHRGQHPLVADAADGVIGHPVCRRVIKEEALAIRVYREARVQPGRGVRGRIEPDDQVAAGGNGGSGGQDVFSRVAVITEAPARRRTPARPRPLWPPQARATGFPG